MKRRNKLTHSGSRRLFTHTAKQTHPLNLRGNPMRGGFRI